MDKENALVRRKFGENEEKKMYSMDMFFFYFDSNYRTHA